MRITILISFLLIGALYVSGQDIHFSQFNASPMNLNPALTGLFNGNYRFVGNHRKQWNSVPVPYTTFSMSADAKLPLDLKDDIAGAGILFNNDRAGDSDFRTSQFGASFSYIRRLTRDAKQFLSLGIQANITSKNFDLAKLTFDNQYNGERYDPAIGANESFQTTKLTYVDFSFGINWLYKIKRRTVLDIGSGLSHLNQPQQSFFANENILLDPKWIINGYFQKQMSPYIDVIPSALIQKQGKSSEIVIGTTVKYLMNPRDADGTAVYFGGFCRLKDAAIATVGMDYNNFKAGISYDINFSRLRVASNGKGGLELSLIYIIKKFTPIKKDKQACPVFM